MNPIRVLNESELSNDALHDQIVYPYTCSYNNTVCHVNGYQFSSAIAFEFYEQLSTDSGDHCHSGKNYFRVDFTQIGRYECEFLDHTFSYRGENDVTVLATPTRKEWCLNTSYPIGGYRGCAIIIRLDKLLTNEIFFFKQFGIPIVDLSNIFSADNHWYKINSSYLTELFISIYRLHEQSNREMVFLKLLEVLLYIAQNYADNSAHHFHSVYYPGAQVKKVKSIHKYIANHYATNIHLENLARKNEINYGVFNQIFKEMYGDPPYRYLKKLRINTAAHQIVETNLNMTEIAASVGYMNPSKFSKAFQSVMGVLPRDFKKQK